jgi:predicted DNA-binding transcriptional regulator YafY
MSLQIGTFTRVDPATEVDRNVIHRFRRALSAVGIGEADHAKIIAACHAEALFPRTFAGSEFHAAASAVDAVSAASAVTATNEMPLAERIAAGAANPKKKESVRFALALLKRLQIPVEACESRETLAEALKTKSLDERFQCKSALAFANILT